MFLRSGQGVLLCSCSLLLCVGARPAARADIGVAVADPTTIGVSPFTHAGHSMIYLSSVCAGSPVRARLCGPGEGGSIVTMYPNFYEGEPYGWNIVPLSLYLQGLYLQGSTDPDARLLYASPHVKQALEAYARGGFLREVCPEGSCGERQHSYWHDLVGSTVDRDIFIYAVHTTPAQDAAVVRWLNDAANVNRYRTLTYNCSSFTQSLINFVFPHAVHRDWINDLGLMSPKAAAHSFTSYALKRPELGFYSMHFAQQPGPMPRAEVARSGTEDGFHMKKYLIPAALIGDHEVAGSFLVAYFLTGRFGLYKQYTRHAVEPPSEHPAARGAGEPAFERAAASASPSAASPETAGSPVTGSPEQWAALEARFAALQAAPDVRAVAPDRGALYPAGFATAGVTVDANGMPWLWGTPSAARPTRKVGLTSANLLAPGSDPELALILMLGRVEYALHAKNHYRETLPELEADWSLLEQARAASARSTKPFGRPSGEREAKRSTGGEAVRPSIP